MADDVLAAMLAALEKPREPVKFNPYRPEPRRPERRTRPSHRDPTGAQAAGNVDKERKKKR